MIAAQTGAAPLVREAPPPALAETVEFLSQRRVDGPAVTLSIFPTARAELIFHFGDPFLAGSTAATARPLPRAALLGPRAKPYWQAAGPRIDWFMIALTPAGCRRLLGLPLAQLWGRDMPLGRFWGEAADALYRQLASAGTFDARISAVEAMLSGLDTAEPAGEIAKIAAAARSGSIKTIEQMCAALSIGPRRLRQVFAAEIGIPPKEFLSIMRFGRHLAALHPAPWIEPEDACATEYVDESHATRAFRRFTNTTPGAYRRAKSMTTDSLIFTGQAFEHLGDATGPKTSE